MTFKINKLEIDEEGNFKVDLPEESIATLLQMFPEAETAEEAFQYYFTLAMSRYEAVETAADVLTDDPLESEDEK